MNASILANLNISDAIKKCDLVQYSHLHQRLSPSRESSLSLHQVSSDVSADLSTITSAPDLLVAIIMKETEGFLEDMETADLQIQLQNANKLQADSKLPAENQSHTVQNNILSNILVRDIQAVDENLPNIPSKMVLNDLCVKSDISFPQISLSPLPPSFLYDVRSSHEEIEQDHSILIEEKKADVVIVAEVEKGSWVKEEVQTKKSLQKTATDDARNGTEAKSEKLPLAEIILASHASLLLHTVYSSMKNSPGVNTDENGRKHHCVPRGSSSGSKRSELGHDERNSRKELVKEGGGTGREKREESEVDTLLPNILRNAAVRSGLPHKSWWLPIRVLKGFLVLQGQVIRLLFILFY